MAEFVWLRKGDKLPAVAVAQVLLNRTGASLTVDGDYGQCTETAVRAFQRARPGLGVDGVIGRNTWPRLVNQERLQIVDCVDVFDPSLMQMEARSLRGVGGNPLLVGGMSNGIEQAVSDIKASASNAFLVRFHGHGAPGAAGVSDGHGAIESASTFRNDPASRSALAQLRGVFGWYGCIQFMHCNTAQGRDGAAFLAMVADVTGVPASAGVRTQFGGSLRQTVRFEGPTRTSCPGRTSLKIWAGSLPAMIGMSVQ